MPHYSIRAAGLSDAPNDYMLCCNGADVGRCYLRPFARSEEQWSWMISFGVYVKRRIESVPLDGYAATLDLAQQQFRESFDRLIAAGVVAVPAPK